MFVFKLLILLLDLNCGVQVDSSIRWKYSSKVKVHVTSGKCPIISKTNAAETDPPMTFSVQNQAPKTLHPGSLFPMIPIHTQQPFFFN